jgi:hypothetical protein
VRSKAVLGRIVDTFDEMAELAVSQPLAPAPERRQLGRMQIPTSSRRRRGPAKVAEEVAGIEVVRTPEPTPVAANFTKADIVRIVTDAAAAAVLTSQPQAAAMPSEEKAAMQARCAQLPAPNPNPNPQPQPSTLPSTLYPYPYPSNPTHLTPPI